MTTTRAHQPIVEVPWSDWAARDTVRPDWQRALEDGSVLHLPTLPFALAEGEARFLDPAFSDERRKSIYIRPGHTDVSGAAASDTDRIGLYAMIRRYEAASVALVAHLFPDYAGVMRASSPSFRPRPSGAAALSWRKDDTRLHTDAFPSNPTHGMRILRVFTNIGVAPRAWRVGDSFEAVARHFLPRIRPPSPLVARVLQTLHVTKRLRSPYDHYMLHLHDEAKRDLAYQKTCPQTAVNFATGATWICYSDQVMHAAMSGQFMMEQTIHVPAAALGYPAQSPLAILERLTQRTLL